MRDQIYSFVRYTSFYKPEKVSEALSYIWACPGKEKWGRILNRMQSAGPYNTKTDSDIREELSLIGIRRDIIAHSVDRPPGSINRNPVRREDAEQVVQFISDLARAIDLETDEQLNSV